MFINKLSIEGYRCFNKNFEIELHKGLNVIVGENGSGKTSIINAFRQLFLDSESGHYNITEDDFHKPFEKGAQAASHFKIIAEFDDLQGKEKVAFVHWSNISGNAVLNLIVENKELRGRYKKILWGGNSRSSQFDTELFNFIHCIYLPPLRDAEAKLINGRQSRLSKLLKFMEVKRLKQCKTDNSSHPLEQKFIDFNASLISDNDISIKRANDLISGHLKQAIGENFSQSTHIQFVENDFTRIVENLRLLFFPDLSGSDVEVFRSLCQNSLGYNNLLYIASILAELTLTATSDEDKITDENSTFYRLLLIEEPEAHLHPQLQVRLLNYLQQVATQNNVQVIVTTHSTVLASSVDLQSITHLTKATDPVATPLRACGLPDESINFINRWLDITKSNLLFASGVILVEGIAEQMIIPELAKKLFSQYDPKHKGLEDLGISVINLNGIYFKHFMRLYCNLTGLENEEDQKGKNIPIRCAGITDLDPDKEQVISQEEITDSDGKTRIIKTKIVLKPCEGNLLPGKNHALKIMKTVNNSESCRLFVSKFKTLEYDLAMQGNNAAVIAGLLAELWPTDGPTKRELSDISLNIRTDVDSKLKANDAHTILQRIDSNEISKGYFAQVLADRLAKNEIALEIPDYITNAILWACSLKAPTSSLDLDEV